MTNSRIRAATITVFVVAVLLRLVLATVNREQSDNHVDVINMMAFENKIPEYDRDRDRVKEAFQPKLYHATVAGILKLDPSDKEWRPCAAEYPGSPHTVWVGQMVSCVAGILTICVVLRFLGLLDLSARTRFFTFSLVALNPALISINVQVTNDSFMILFGSLSVYWAYRFFRDFRLWDFVWMTAAAISTVMSKATGLPLCLAITLVFAITVARTSANATPRPTTVLLYAVVFWVALLASLTIVAPKVGSYWELYRRYGSPFVTNRFPEPFPRLFEPTAFTGDPGVRSIAESLFTFRIIGLLRDPLVVNGRVENYPLHRTSLWSGVYGRTNFIRFDDYFESWRPRSALATSIARLTFMSLSFSGAPPLRCVRRHGIWSPTPGRAAALMDHRHHGSRLHCVSHRPRASLSRLLVLQADPCLCRPTRVPDAVRMRVRPLLFEVRCASGRTRRKHPAGSVDRPLCARLYAARDTIVPKLPWGVSPAELILKAFESASGRQDASRRPRSFPGRPGRLLDSKSCSAASRSSRNAGRGAEEDIPLAEVGNVRIAQEPPRRAAWTTARSNHALNLSGTSDGGTGMCLGQDQSIFWPRMLGGYTSQPAERTPRAFVAHREVERRHGVAPSRIVVRSGRRRRATASAKALAIRI
jgi:hypothetical protein